MEIVYSKQAVKDLKSIQKQEAIKIMEQIAKLPLGDVKALQGSEGQRYRLRVGRYRALFYYLENDIIIYKVAPRSKIYKGDYLWLQQHKKRM